MSPSSHRLCRVQPALRVLAKGTLRVSSPEELHPHGAISQGAGLREAQKLPEGPEGQHPLGALALLNHNPLPLLTHNPHLLSHGLSGGLRMKTSYAMVLVKR